MSVRAITAAYAAKTGSASNKSVLVALADHANDANECWPSISRLAKKTELHPDTIRRSLRDLERRGLITRTERYHDDTKYRRSDNYKLHLTSPHGATISPQGATISPQDAGGDTRTVQGTYSHHAGDIEPSLKPSEEPSEKPSDFRRPPGGTPTIENDFFDSFWSAYPKRQGGHSKKAAKQKFEAALKKGIDPDVIIAGVKRYAKQMRDENKIGGPYVAHAETWLNKERWNDNAPEPVVDPNANKIKIAVDSEQGQVWTSYEKYTRYIAHCKSDHTKFQFRIPTAIVNSQEFYLVDEEWPAEPVGKVFVEPGPLLDEWCCYANAENRSRIKMAAYPFRVAGQIKHGWWFDTEECPHRWIDADTPEFIALDNEEFAKRRRHVLVAHRNIYGAERQGTWRSKVQPELKAAA